MTERLREAEQSFVELWGNMATNWGVSKSMAQVYALLFASSEPLDTEAIMEELSISRGNANINIRKLIEWGLLSKTHKNETRRDYFVAEKDVWTLASRIIEERQKLELTPLDEQIRKIAYALDEEANPARPEENAAFKKHLLEMAQFVSLFEDLSAVMLPILKTKDYDSIKAMLEMLRQYQRA